VSTLDLKALALILDAGRCTASARGETELASVLQSMTETAVALQTGTTVDRPVDMFADLRDRYGF
jgi:hypothetical protein